MIGPSVTGAGICGRPGRSMATLSMNDEIALSAWSTLFCANSRTCGGTSIFNFGSIMAVSLRDGFVRLSHFGRAAFCKSAPVGHSEYCCTDCFRDQRRMVTHLLDRTQTPWLLTTLPF